MKPFEQLTARGQVRRLRRMALSALAQYPFKVRSLRLLLATLNCIFRVDTEGGEKYILRICIPGHRTLEEIRSETLWLAAISRDTDLLVPKPMLNKEGQMVTTVETPGVPEARHCLVFGWVNGVDLYHNMVPENYEKLGRFTAALHNHSESWEAPAELSLRDHEEVLFFDWGMPHFWEQEDPEFLPPGRVEIFKRSFEKTSAVFREMYRSKGSPKVIHADLHQGNVRLFRGLMRALDFDDCMLGHWIQDIGITFYYMQSREHKEALMEAYQKGYEQVRGWPSERKGVLEAVIAGRDLMLCQHIYFGTNPLYKNWIPSLFSDAETRLEKYLEAFS